MPDAPQIVLAEVDVAAAVELHDAFEAPLPGAHRAALVVQMNHGGAREIVDLPARVPDATAVVRVTVIEEPLVESSDPLHDFAADHQRRPRDQPRRERLAPVAREMEQMLPREAVVREQLADERAGSEDRRARAGQALHRRLDGAIGMDESAADGARAGMTLEKGHHVVERTGRDDRVVVQEIKISPARHRERAVVRASVVQIALVDEQPHPGEPRPDHVGATVSGGIVHDEHFVGRVGRVRLDRRQAAGQRGARVVVRDDD